MSSQEHVGLHLYKHFFDKQQNYPISILIQKQVILNVELLVAILRSGVQVQLCN